MTPGHLHPQGNRNTSPAGGIGFDTLAVALKREAKLLTDLLSVMQQQRDAVGAEDLGIVDDTIFSAQRILRTLAEARVKRRTLLEILGCDPELPLDDLEEILGPRMTPEVLDALQTLRTVALNLTGELDVNRRVLQSALRSGDDLIRVLGGGGDTDPGIYSSQPEQPVGSGDHGLIIDRQI